MRKCSLDEQAGSYDAEAFEPLWDYQHDYPTVDFEAYHDDQNWFELISDCFKDDMWYMLLGDGSTLTDDDKSIHAPDMVYHMDEICGDKDIHSYDKMIQHLGSPTEAYLIVRDKIEERNDLTYELYLSWPVGNKIISITVYGNTDYEDGYQTLDCNIFHLAPKKAYYEDLISNLEREIEYDAVCYHFIF